MFRFSINELESLLQLLQVPEEITFRNRTKCTGEEFLLVGLYRLVNVCDLYDMVKLFGSDVPRMSRMFSSFVRWIYRQHSWRLFDNLNYWVPHFPRCAEAIRKKVITLSGGQLNYDAGTFTVSGFINCHNQYVGRVGAGPAGDGAGQQRADPTGWLQRVFYNGWFAAHDLKYGTVDLACGLTAFASPRDSSRLPDLTFLTEFQINEKLEEAQAACRISRIVQDLWRFDIPLVGMYSLSLSWQQSYA